jgi:S1-C subfamily serine protease
MGPQPGRGVSAGRFRGGRPVNALDVLLIVAAVSFAVSGYRQGFIVGVLSFAGFLGGGLLGMVVLPNLLSSVEPGVGAAVLLVGSVLLLAAMGQILAAFVGGQVRQLVTWSPARVVDAGAGAVVSVLAMLVIAWALGTALASSSVPTVARQVRNSEILGAVQRVMPVPATGLFSSFQRLLDDSGFPDVFAGISPEQIIQVEQPDSALARSAAVRRVRPSIVKILGTAPDCRRQVEGTGFVYAPRRVMTNAHVVAGVRRPQVVVRDDRLPAEVVVYDSRRDLAVLEVPGLDADTLDFAGAAARGDDAIVAGYPNNGPFTVVPARVRTKIIARGSDIYGRTEVRREVYSIRSIVEPGNSGGPLLATNGDVYGVIFAASVEDPETGYALTAAEVAPVAAAGRRASQSVSTQECA